MCARLVGERVPPCAPHDLVFPLADADHALLSVVEHDVLAPPFVERVLSTVATAPDVNRPAVQAQVRQLEAEVANLTTAIAAGGDIPVLVASLQEKDAQRRRLLAQLAPRTTPDQQALRDALLQRVGNSRELRRQPGKRAWCCKG
jgi:hypothetical protein